MRDHQLEVAIRQQPVYGVTFHDVKEAAINALASDKIRSASLKSLFLDSSFRDTVLIHEAIDIVCFAAICAHRKAAGLSIPPEWDELIKGKFMSKLKHEDIATPGDRIRSYDFAGRTDCYIEGVVQRIIESSYKAFVVLVDKDCFPSKNQSVSRIGQVVYVPMEIALTDYDGRIINLSKSAVSAMETEQPNAAVD